MRSVHSSAVALHSLAAGLDPWLRGAGRHPPAPSILEIASGVAGRGPLRAELAPVQTRRGQRLAVVTLASAETALESFGAHHDLTPAETRILDKVDASNRTQAVVRLTRWSP